MTDVLTSADSVRLYREMLRLRLFEDRVLELFQASRMPGTVHQYQGQEAVAVGACASLTPRDLITSTHRSHGHALARGLSFREVMAELYGRAPGCCSGKGGSMHLGSFAQGMLPAIAIVGGALPIAAGLALSQQMQNTGAVTAAFFGDGAVAEGAFHEAVNLAAIWRLPLVLVCENNFYGASTPFSLTSPVPHIADRAAAYGLPAATVDGMDVEAVRAAVGGAVDRARAGEGPTLLECETFRFCGHSRSDRNKYRTEEEEVRWRACDPLDVQRQRLEAADAWTDEADAALRREISEELEEAIVYAEAADFPAPAELYTDVFAPGAAGATDYWPGENAEEVRS